MKRRIVRSFILAVALCLPFIAAHAADLKDPAQIIKKSQAYALSLDSISYTVKSEGWDTNPSANAKRVSSAAGEAAEKFGSVANVAKDVKKEAEKTDTSKWDYKKFETKLEFKKPYLIQMYVVMSEYTPKIVWKSFLTYRPDKDPAVFWFKPGISPMAIKREIGGESGGLPAQVLYYEYAIMDILTKNAKPALKGTKKIGGRDAYIVEWVYPKTKKLKMQNPDFKKWGTPKEGQKIFTDELKKFADNQHTARTAYLFDKETLLPVGREDYLADGKLLSKREWTDLKVNTLNEKDF